MIAQMRQDSNHDQAREKEDTEADFLDKEASLISNIKKSSKREWGSPSSVLSFRFSGEAEGEREQEDRHRNNVVLTLLTVVGGFWLLMISCLGFKFFGGKYNLRAPDRLAEYINTSPTASTQLFTFLGVILGEITLLLWGNAIAHFATRRLAYKQPRTELLTFAALNEMLRAGYTLSRRRPLWPAVTLFIFLTNTFLPSAFSTLLYPKPMVYIVPFHGVELDELSGDFAAAVAFMPVRSLE
ncbi:hypothetical protein FA10DRAFT_297501 [Acaromyces ingoldii]|uniref:Uncharacterized protein n=1 Tax=Acaromyces ingoldii TaxID=215250 RepID=A0A316YCX6_9BASI|nr:hypothetical protein FA10DRAFT_297501 [Acaromyces ingoldii]PWN87079.1 hypothetical protein FA10DRAFT_297501 [Acaromyces ingoldii]